MTSNLTALVAHEHTADLLRAAQQEARGRLSSRPDHHFATVALRLASDKDAQALRALADLDDTRALDGEVLLAAIDEQPVAALSLRDGRVVANPFVRTFDAVALLRLRAQHLAGVRQRRGLRRLRPRFA